MWQRACLAPASCYELRVAGMTILLEIGDHAAMDGLSDRTWHVRSPKILNFDTRDPQSDASV